MAEEKRIMDKELVERVESSLPSPREKEKFFQKFRSSTSRDSKRMGWLFNVILSFENDRDSIRKLDPSYPVSPSVPTSLASYKFPAEVHAWIRNRKKRDPEEGMKRKRFKRSENSGKGTEEFPVGLQECLDNPTYLTFLEDFLKENDFEMVTNFLIDVQEFRRIKHLSTKKAAARSIWDRYINPKSSHAIRLYKDIIQSVTNSLSAETLNESIFDESYDLVFDRLEKGNFQLFIYSRSYMEMLPQNLREILIKESENKDKKWINSSSFRSLHVDVISGYNLQSKDGSSKPDPIAIVSVGSKNYRTDVVRNSSRPNWEKRFELPVNSASIACKVSVWNKDRSGNAKDFLGEVVTYLCDIPASMLPKWYVLSGNSSIADDSEEFKGQIHLRFTFSHDSPEDNKEALIIDTGGPSVADVFRSKVSKKKKRFVDDGYNLDLSYITDHIIAMGFPSESIEGIYRNNMKNVQKFFKTRHTDHFWVYNLCEEREYPPEKFDNRVSRFPFADHNPCPWNMVIPFCEHVSEFLKFHPQNVVCIHCKAGKGRTGMLISCALLYMRQFDKAEAALSYFAEKRTKNQKGVTIPSQKRYVKYTELYLNSVRNAGFPLAIPSSKYVLLKQISIINAPLNIKPSSIQLKIKTPTYDFSSKHTSLQIVSCKIDGFDSYMIKIPSELILPLNHDIKFVFSSSTMFRQEKMFHFWINTRFLQGYELTLRKDEIDKAVKDKKHKLYSEKMHLKLNFEFVDESMLDMKLDEVSIIKSLMGGISSTKAFEFGDKSARAEREATDGIDGKDENDNDHDIDEDDDEEEEESVHHSPGNISLSSLRKVDSSSRDVPVVEKSPHKYSMSSNSYSLN